MSWPLERTFYLGVAFATAGLVAIGVVQYATIPDLMEADRQAAHAEVILATVNHIMASADDADNLARAFAFQGRGEYRQFQELAVSHARSAHQELRTLAAGDARLTHLLIDLSKLLDQCFREMDEVMRLAANGRTDGVVRFLARGEPTQLRQAARWASQEILDYERGILRSNREASGQRWYQLRVLVGCGLFMAILPLAVAVILVHRGTRRRNLVQRELLRERHLLRTLLEHVPVGVFFKDTERRFTRASRFLAELVHVDSPAYMEGRTLEELIPHEPAEVQRIQDLEVLRTGRAVVGEERHMVWEGGPDAWLLKSTVPYYDEDNTLVGLLGVTVDVTPRKRAEVAREEAAARLTEWAGQLEQHNRHEEILADMNQLLQTCGSESEAGGVICRYLPALYPSASGHLSLTKPSRNIVESIAVWGEHEAQALVFSPQQCWALRRGRPHHSGLERLEPPCEHGCGRSGCHSYCVPMMAHGENIGVFSVSESAAPFADAQQQLAIVAAERIGLALANLRLRDALRVLSVRDPLTGLFNRRYMEESSEREFRRATRHDRPLAVVMGDIDHFKRFNDTFGHEAGDALLREFGSLLQSHTRKEDIACRYGGEEFLLLLPELTRESACLCVEKLRKAVAHLTVNLNGQTMGQVTASFGVAVFPEHGDSMAALTRAADSALYAAKKAGRDRVAVATAIGLGTELAS